MPLLSWSTFVWEIGKLEFNQVDHHKYPCFQLILDAAKLGKSFPTVICATDDILVNAFINNQIKYTDIPKYLEKIINQHKPSIITRESILEITKEKYIPTPPDLEIKEL